MKMSSIRVWNFGYFIFCSMNQMLMCIVYDNIMKRCVEITKMYINNFAYSHSKNGF